MHKLIFFIFITFSLFYNLSAEENSLKKYQDIEEMGILNYAVNTNETVLLINTASYEDWSTTVYACNPGKGNLNWSFRKIGIRARFLVMFAVWFTVQLQKNFIFMLHGLMIMLLTNTIMEYM